MVNKRQLTVHQPASSSSPAPWEPKPWPKFPPDISEASFNRRTQVEFEQWVQWQYCMHAWRENGEFQGFTWFKNHLKAIEPHRWQQITETLRKLRDPAEKFALPLLDKNWSPMIQLTKKARKTMLAERADWESRRVQVVERLSHEARQTQAVNPQLPATAVSSNTTIPNRSIDPPAINASPSIGTFPPSNGPAAVEQDPVVDQAALAAPSTNDENSSHHGTGTDLLARKLGQIHLEDPSAPREQALKAEDQPQDAQRSPEDGEETFQNAEEEFHDAEEEPYEPDFDAMDDLLGGSSRTESGLDSDLETIRHAPLVDESFIRKKDLSDTLPQYGLMGVHDQTIDNATAKLFLNANVPFSAFVCGVQGSGKSHTTSCILENCLIPSKALGKLQQPLSALVFSYGLWSGNGAGFNVSEAAFLGAPNPRFGGGHVKQINVLVSPTNYIRIKKKYERLPNVRVTSFRLNPKNLDIGLMLQLMQVDESAQGPLYLGEVQRILREIWASHEEFDYALFKQRIEKHSSLDALQRNMLNMRLGILDWFLDLKGEHREDVVFRPGEVTIMDLSCPFVDANTACIMFRCGLQRYLQTDASGKMIVLDEAHKYMLDVPGAKALQASIHHTIAVQRHQAVRCIVSSQEPTLLVKLIGLCSVSFIHRFTSPEWFTAIRQNIPIPEQDRDGVMRSIEGLPTGTAMVYSANSVLGYEEESQLKRGTGILMKVRMRNRITRDGGQSILAV